MDTTQSKLIKTIVAFVFLAVIIFSSFGTISAGQVGVKTRFGAIVGTVNTGLYFKIPFFDSVHKMNVKTVTVQFDKSEDGDSTLSSASKDLQDVRIATVVNYHVDASKVQNIYQQYNSVENYQQNVIEPIIREVVKSTSALYTADELVTKRAEFSDKVGSTLGATFATKDALLEKFSVTNFEFSKSFNEAIEAKVTAQQNAEAAKNKLEQVKFEAEQTIASAKAEAEAQRISSQALAAQGGKDYVQLKAIEKWDGHLPAQMVPGSTVPFINLTK